MSCWGGLRSERDARVTATGSGPLKLSQVVVREEMDKAGSPLLASHQSPLTHDAPAATKLSIAGQICLRTPRQDQAPCQATTLRQPTGWVPVPSDPS